MGIDSLVAALEDANSDVREAAVIALGRHGDPCAADALAGSLADHEPGVRVCAAVALSKLGWSPRSAEEESLFEQAITELGNAAGAGETALQPLLEELTEAITIRLQGSTEFQETSGVSEPSEVEALPAESQSDEQDLSLSFDQPLPSAGEPDAPAAAPPEEPPAVNGFAYAPEPAADEPLAADAFAAGDNTGSGTQGSNGGEPSHAPPAGTVPELLRAAEEGDINSRVAAIYALGGIQGEEVTATLLNCMDDQDSTVRLAAAQVLAEWGDPAHAPCFLAKLADDDSDMRLVAVRFVTRIDDPQVVGLLCPMLGASDVMVRRAAVQALGSLRDRAAIEDLIVALLDEEPGVRVAATAALEQIDRRWPASPEAQRTRPRLQELLTHPRPGMGNAALQLLDHLRASAPAPNGRAAR